MKLRQPSTTEEALSMIDEQNLPEWAPSQKIRLAWTKLLYNVLGYELLPDSVANTVDMTSKSRVISAIAGSGKSTSLHVFIALMKTLRNNYGKRLYGNKVLCLTYNKHNATEMIMRHRILVGRLLKANIKDFDIDYELSAYTLHRLCGIWKKEHPLEFGLSGFEQITKGQRNYFLREAYSILSDALGLETVPEFYEIASLFNYIESTYYDWDHPQVIRRANSTKLSATHLKMTYKMYNDIKRKNKVYDHSEVLDGFIKAMEKEPLFAQRVQNYYEVIAVDEVQDLTPALIKVIQLILLGPEKYLLCMGDEDQTIYGFNGARTDTITKFNELFPDSVAYTLGKNYRCGDNLVQVANHVVSKNTERFPKKMVGLPRRTNISFVPYSSEEGQIHRIVSQIEKFGPDELEETVIACRDQVFTGVLTDLLEKKKIPFKVMSGISPYTFELYKHMFHVLDGIYAARERASYRYLYKALPISKDNWYKLIKYDELKERFRGENLDIPFWEIELAEFEAAPSLRNTIEAMKLIHENVAKAPLREYSDVVFNLVCSNYWNYVKPEKARSYQDQFFFEEVYKYFDSSKAYYEFYLDYRNTLSDIKAYSESYGAVSVGTLHSLKGSEYDTVFLYQMEDGVFPKPLREGEDELEHLEGERRLAYMALTRAKKDLYLMYPENNPSIYVQESMQFLESSMALQQVSSSAEQQKAEVKFNPQGKFGSSLLGRLGL